MSSPFDRFSDKERHPDRKHNHLLFSQRDMRILEHIYAYGGVLRADHIRQLEFAGTSGKACQSRLSRLFHNDFLSRTSPLGVVFCEGMVYWLTRQGAQQIADRFGQEWLVRDFVFSPVWTQIHHDLRIVDALFVFQQACAVREDITVTEWMPERLLRSTADTVQFQLPKHTKPAKQKVIPDAFLRLQRQQANGEWYQSRLLIEIDNSTHPNQRFVETKVLPGTAWIRSAAYAEKFGANRGRWLVITKTEQRLWHLKKATETAASRDAEVWYFTTHELFSAETALTAPIWYRGGDDTPIALFRDRNE